MRGDALLVFVKNPEPGTVKTRLARELGKDLAAETYRRLAESSLRRTTPAPGSYERTVCFAPAAAQEAVARWLPYETLEPQCEGDLGERMQQAFAGAFARGARRVVLIGSDVPGLDRAAVLAAFAALDGPELVLGPADDGGYYMVGLANPQPRLFAGITWSQPEVLSQTLERAAALRLRVRLLARLRDVDTLQDLREEWGVLEPLLEAEAPGLADALSSRLFSQEVGDGRP